MGVVRGSYSTGAQWFVRTIALRSGPGTDAEQPIARGEHATMGRVRLLRNRMLSGTSSSCLLDSEVVGRKLVERHVVNIGHRAADEAVNRPRTNGVEQHDMRDRVLST